jgi:hypothetical protein
MYCRTNKKEASSYLWASRAQDSELVGKEVIQLEVITHIFLRLGVSVLDNEYKLEFHIAY